MANRKNSSYNRGAKHRGEHGNLVKNLLHFIVGAGDVSGDVIQMDTGPWDSEYVEISVESDGTSGLTVDVGVTASDGSFDDPDYFSAATDATAAGKDYLLNRPTKVLNADGKQIAHDLTITLGGTVTAGDEIWIVTEALYYGAPE